MSRSQPGGKRLLAINNYFYRRGGAEAVFFDHMKMFGEIGWDVVPFAMQHEDSEPSPWSDHFVSEIEGSRLVVYEGAGHALHWEEPQRFAADLATFVARTVAPDRRAA